MEKGKNSVLIAWRTTYEEHGPDILAFLRSRLHNKEDAEDILQETFVRAIKSTDSIQNLEKIRSYLFTIAHNLLVNHVKRQRDVCLDPDDEVDDPFDRLAIDNTHDPEVIIERKELDKKLKSVLNSLKPAHRKAFQLSVLESKPYSEISRLTDWSISQVKINVYRARKQVITELQDWLTEDRRK